MADVACIVDEPLSCKAFRDPYSRCRKALDLAFLRDVCILLPVFALPPSLLPQRLVDQTAVARVAAGTRMKVKVISGFIRLTTWVGFLLFGVSWNRCRFQSRRRENVQSRDAVHVCGRFRVRSWLLCDVADSDLLNLTFRTTCVQRVAASATIT